MPKEEVYEELVSLFKIEKSLHTVLLDDLNNNFHVYSVGFPGLHQMLTTLKEQEYKLGIITNGRDFLPKKQNFSFGNIGLF